MSRYMKRTIVHLDPGNQELLHYSPHESTRGTLFSQSTHLKKN